MAPTPTVHCEDATELAKRVWGLLAANGPAAGLPRTTVRSMAEFVQEADASLLNTYGDKTEIEARELILDQATALFQNVYAHLPFKQRDFQSDPVGALEETRKRVHELSASDFHISVMKAFGTVRDPHTLYHPPAPWNHSIAFLPFRVGRFLDPTGKPRFIVCRLMASAVDPATGDRIFEHPDFQEGAEIVSWNGRTIQDAIAGAMDTGTGASQSASKLMAFNRLTANSLAVSSPVLVDPKAPPPYRKEESVVVEYIPASGGPPRGIGFPWGVVSAPGLVSLPRTAFSMHRQNLHQELMHDRLAVPVGTATPVEQPSKIPDAFYFATTGNGSVLDGFEPDQLQQIPGKKFGYIKIRRFHGTINGTDADSDDLADEFRRILGIMENDAPDGIVLDLRGNPGGDVEAAERMLQMLCSDRIEPALFHLPNTPAVQSILKLAKSHYDQALATSQCAGKDAAGGLQAALFEGGGDPRIANAIENWHPWFAEVDNPSSGSLTVGRPISNPDKVHAEKRAYSGRVALLIDPSVYSAAEIFAGGFDDHDIGLIVGFDERSGGGGANVWSYEDLQSNLPTVPGLNFQDLPQDVSMTVAIRRSSRVKDNAGKPIEDLAVESMFHFDPRVFVGAANSEDVIAGHPKLVAKALALVSHLPDRKAWSLHLPGFSLSSHLPDFLRHKAKTAAHSAA